MRHQAHPPRPVVLSREARLSFLNGPWQDCVHIRRDTLQKIEAFQARIFVSDYKMPATAAAAQRRAT
jgi:hypothetical protein